MKGSSSYLCLMGRRWKGNCARIKGCYALRYPTASRPVAFGKNRSVGVRSRQTQPARNSRPKKSQLADRSAAASTVEQRPSARPTSDLWHICRRVGLIGSREPLGLQIGAHEPAGRYRTRASVACPLHHALDRRRRVHHACRASSGARAPRRSGGLGALRNHRKTLLGASAVVDPSRGRDRTLDGLAP